MLSEELRVQGVALLDAAPCQVVLPAGAGKTELVAAAGRVADERGERILMLTHTHAGVDALRRRLARVGARPRFHRVATIDGWCRRLVEAFPVRSGYDAGDDPDWSQIRAAASTLLESPHVRRVLRASYAFVVTDEYQDCSHAQHAVLRRLSEDLPVVALGDPLQAIYAFPGDPVVDWNVALDHLPLFAPEIQPWRWIGHNLALGHALTRLRQELIAGTPVDLNTYPEIGWVQDGHNERRATAWGKVGVEGSVVVLERWAHACLDLGRRLGGNFGVMEELEGNRLLAVATRIDGDDGVAAARAVIDLAAGCHASLPAQLASKGRAMETGTFPNFTAANQAAGALAPLRSLSQELSAENTVAAIEGIDALGGTLFGKEAWKDFGHAARLWAEAPDDHTMTSAVRAVRDRARLLGRHNERRSISRTLLVKGLEYDHCVVNRAHELNACELYVAMTRGRRSLTVLSASPVLTPA